MGFHLSLPYFYILFFCFIITSGCSDLPGNHPCRTPLTYQAYPIEEGHAARPDITHYVAQFDLGHTGFLVDAIVDTASSQLIINQKELSYGPQTETGQIRYNYNNGVQKAHILNARDSLQIGCSTNTPTQFGLTSPHGATNNILGLSFGDPQRLPHEAQNKDFFSQLVNQKQFSNIFSLALCSYRNSSFLLLGGIDPDLAPTIGNFIPMAEKTSYVVPALSLRRADNKKLMGFFPEYSPTNNPNQKTYLDSASAFLYLPQNMAQNMAQEVRLAAKALNISSHFPKDFFDTRPSNPLKTIRFASLVQIRQFPFFEIEFQGLDNSKKSLVISPLFYLKSVNTKDSLVRGLALREAKNNIILGQPFLENHYLVFDRTQGAIGFGDIDRACTQ